MGQKKWEKLLKVVNSKKRVYRKRKRKEIEKSHERRRKISPTAPMRVEMTNWYHGKFTGIKTRNCNEEQLWGDLSRQQEMKLKKILKGEF